MNGCIDYEIKSLGVIVVDKKIAYDHIDDYKCVITPEEILNHSFNIIDLIEEGDYENGIVVTQSELNDIEHLAKEIVKNNYGIRTIVTKEQFKAMEYEVK